MEVVVVVCSAVVTGDCDSVNTGSTLFVPVAMMDGVALKNSTPEPPLMELEAPFTHATPLYLRIWSTTGEAMVVSDRLARGMAMSAEPLKATPAMFRDVVSVAAEPEALPVRFAVTAVNDGLEVVVNAWLIAVRFEL